MRRWLIETDGPRWLGKAFGVFGYEWTTSANHADRYATEAEASAVMDALRRDRPGLFRSRKACVTEHEWREP